MVWKRGIFLSILQNSYSPSKWFVRVCKLRVTRFSFLILYTALLCERHARLHEVSPIPEPPFPLFPTARGALVVPQYGVPAARNGVFTFPTETTEREEISIQNERGTAEEQSPSATESINDILAGLSGAPSPGPFPASPFFWIFFGLFLV